jgi:hypothetical protein
MKGHLKLLSFFITLLAFVSCQKEFSRETGAQLAGTLLKDASGNCLPQLVSGIYIAGKALKADSNYVDIQVDVTTPGTYQISTDEVNGIRFSATGSFAATGVSTVRLKGTGTPAASATSAFVVTYNGSSCEFEVIVLPDGGSSDAVFTFIGAPNNCTDFILSGAYANGTVLNSPANNVVIKVQVTSPGTYNIATTPVNGISFAGSGALASPGQYTIVLTASGTPVTTGDFNIPVTVSGSTCSFPLKVTGPAVYTINCGSAVVNGDYTQAATLTAANTISVELTATTAGAYLITGTVNGMTFTGSGTAVAGAQTVTLTGSGAPLEGGDFSIPLAGGTATCNVDITVEDIPVPTDMVWEFKQGSTTYSGPSTGGVAGTIDNAEALSFNGTSAVGNFAFVFSIRKVGGLTTGDYSTKLSSPYTQVILLNVSTAETMYISSIAGGALTMKITLLDRANKIIQGTFSGTALNAAGTLVPVSGSFKGPIL